MFVTIINDCRDNNDAGRQSTRVASIFAVTPTFVGVQNDTEAAGILLDVLDASEGSEGIVFVNVAPRSGDANHFQNGSPFGYFRHDKTIVVSSVSGSVLHFVRRLHIVDSVQLMDIQTVLAAMAKRGKFPPDRIEEICWSQFRSFDFLPRVGHWLYENETIPTTEYRLDQVAPVEKQIWHIDSFGNAKTSCLPADVEFAPGKTIQTQFGHLPCYTHLRDVPDGQTALVIGSSGIRDQRFLEVVTQGASAADKLKLKIGDRII